MTDLIQWCNENQGFISAILAMFSLFLSVIAIVVSVSVAKIPFNKKIAVAFYTNVGVGLSNGIQFYSIEATNIGNRIIKISYIGVGYRERLEWKKIYNINDINPSNVMLGINDTAEVQYGIQELNSVKKKKLYAIAIDVEGKIYKRRIK